MASGTSKETEIKLTNVARASLEELLEDYHDYLRTGEYELWDKNSKEATYVRKLSSGKIKMPEIPHLSQESQKSHSSEEQLRLIFVNFFKTRPANVSANIVICLINQCTFLLNRQIKQLEEEFVAKGGLRENMYNARVNYRKK